VDRARFLPDVDAGQIRMHVVAASGTRLEETEKIFSAVEAEIRKTIPPEDVEMIIDNLGVPSEQYNMAFGDSATLGTQDGEILIALKHERRKGAPAYAADLRTAARSFPESHLLFPARRHRQPDPELRPQIADQRPHRGLQQGRELADRPRAARPHRADSRRGDVHLHQDVAAPELRLNVDRTRLAENGITQRDLANDVMITLASSTQVTPNYWVDPVAGRPYLVAVKTPVASRRFAGCAAAHADRHQGGRAAASRQPRRRSSAAMSPGPRAISISSRSMMSSRTCRAATSEAWSTQSTRSSPEFQPKMAPGQHHHGEGPRHEHGLRVHRLGIGFIAAIVLVYFLMVVNYQSWLDPFIIIMALPGAFAGIIWALFLTGTTLNVPSLMGAMMAVGVATANSILMVTFANQQMLAGKDSIGAVLTAGSVRLRPRHHDRARDDSRHAADVSRARRRRRTKRATRPRRDRRPQHRDFATLFFVPVIFSLLRKKPNPILAEDTEVPLDALTVNFPNGRETATTH
jgi:multidrug efflux pump subunit AcrB